VGGTQWWPGDVGKREHGSLGIYGVWSHFQATTGEDTRQRRLSACCSTAYCKTGISETVTLTHELSPINPITNPNLKSSVNMSQYTTAINFSILFNVILHLSILLH
jgi:hypothetical protein